MTTPSADNVRICEECGYELRPSDILCPACGVAAPAPLRGSWTNPYQPPPKREPRGVAVFVGLLASNVFAILMMLLSRWLFNKGGANNGLYLASDFTVLPLAMGILAAFCWKRLDLTGPEYFGYSVAICILSLCAASYFLGEGVICLVMASPLLMLVIWIGCMIGKAIFIRDNNRLNLSIAPVLLALVIADSLTPHHFHGACVDTITINAPPEQVWRYIADYPALTEKPHYWLFDHGLPMPMTATSDGAYVGSRRTCVFSHNAIFDEKIVEVQPNQKLTFDILRQPPDPELIGHLKLERGQFLLTRNPNGTTTLTGTSWYKLNVYPVTYFDWWTQDVIRHVHLRVMEHIKTLAEAKQQQR
ncbi:hypothetical protein CCAX7_006610 [Capsulimonas corticalis]|uniref:Uncharacterized protein n=1 Tax=Capsulimonas corticalis TaxID=2219043 RepID=A0A402D1D7_9BACT|nr:SRPBCC family protein [Capsulimonas corticalis]BDI28610.1 hypothetical protein CCAX7_006610 [Capsulimonas corticalis]